MNSAMLHMKSMVVCTSAMSVTPAKESRVLEKILSVEYGVGANRVIVCERGLITCSHDGAMSIEPRPVSFPPFLICSE